MAPQTITFAALFVIAEHEIPNRRYDAASLAERCLGTWFATSMEELPTLDAPQPGTFEIRALVDAPSDGSRGWTIRPGTAIVRRRTRRPDPSRARPDRTAEATRVRPAERPSRPAAPTRRARRARRARPRRRR